jgi:hypothetical protein
MDGQLNGCKATLYLLSFRSTPVASTLGGLSAETDHRVWSKTHLAVDDGNHAEDDKGLENDSIQEGLLGPCAQKWFNGHCGWSSRSEATEFRNEFKRCRPKRYCLAEVTVDGASSKWRQKGPLVRGVKRRGCKVGLESKLIYDWSLIPDP